MIVSDILDEIEIEATAKRLTLPDRFKLLMMLNSELNELAGEADWEWVNVYLDPAITTVESQRNYVLPRNFPLNFTQRGDGYAVTLDDASSESTLAYKGNAEFYARNLTGESDGTPSVYTVVTRGDGQRELVLSPPPDSTARTINGVYQPSDWQLREESALPVPVPSIMKYAVLRRFAPELYEPQYGNALRQLLNASGRARPARMKPKMGEWEGSNNWALMRGW